MCIYFYRTTVHVNFETLKTPKVKKKCKVFWSHIICVRNMALFCEKLPSLPLSVNNGLEAIFESKCKIKTYKINHRPARALSFPFTIMKFEYSWIPILLNITHNNFLLKSIRNHPSIISNHLTTPAYYTPLFICTKKHAKLNIWA